MEGDLPQEFRNHNQGILSLAIAGSHGSRERPLARPQPSCTVCVVPTMDLWYADRGVAAHD